MLSIASLTALSGINPVHPTLVRLPGSQPPGAPPPPPQGPSTGKGAGGVEPTRMLPRGSLLDLSA
ncbi:MAG TPA: hypothetical protein VND19_03180 [Acetobacteraceae bacterium]|nr:hypothetical protein [Acetobacteraceae bacterium]